MNTHKLKALAGLFAGALSVQVTAMEAIEEIEVTGQRTLLALRIQVEAAQDEVHLLFNELNTDDDFDIVCKVEERYFSKMKEKNCMPRYAWDARAKEGQIFAQKITGEAHAEGPPANLEIDSFEPALKEQMIEALRHSPELFDAIVKHATLMEELARAQATYFGDEAPDDH
jgi:hypothetical protein